MARKIIVRKGWRKEPARHSLASRGVKTQQFTPGYIVARRLWGQAPDRYTGQTPVEARFFVSREEAMRYAKNVQPAFIYEADKKTKDTLRKLETAELSDEPQQFEVVSPHLAHELIDEYRERGYLVGEHELDLIEKALKTRRRVLISYNYMESSLGDINYRTLRFEGLL